MQPTQESHKTIMTFAMCDRVCHLLLRYIHFKIFCGLLGSMYTKTKTIQTRLTWSLHEENMQILPMFFVHLPNVPFLTRDNIYRYTVK